jgi:histidyl-tRNA synthetase
MDSTNKVNVKVVKGARDYLPSQMIILNRVFKLITDIYKKHGAVQIDTPVFELKETLLGKYGEDSKLIYDLQDQGGELLSLRYDLTVPFARYIATNNMSSIKRFHIAKVYRRDSPQMSRGRFREFYQCDFDIAGSNYARMAADAESLKVLVEILDKLEIGKYVIKINHRCLLDTIIFVCDIPEDKFKTVCSSIDKLDKEPWDKIKSELLNKGLTEQQSDKIWEYVQLKNDPWTLYTKLKDDVKLNGVPKGNTALEDMEILFKYMDIFEITDKFIFDLSLARGLDYYTGVIFEAVMTDTDKIGSIAGGGRYDDLVGMFSNKKIPSVGMSVGIERIFSLIEEKAKVKDISKFFRWKNKLDKMKWMFSLEHSVKSHSKKNSKF